VNVGEMRYSNPRVAHTREVRRSDFKAGSEQCIKIERRSSVGSDSIVDMDEGPGTCLRWKKGQGGRALG
jgi:hypothetical protein